MIRVISSLILFLMFSCNGKKQDQSAENAPGENSDSGFQMDTSKYSVAVFEIEPGENNSEGFGFELTMKGQGNMKIRQPNIPAIQGNQPFITEEDARSTALLMVSKLEKGIMPPAVTVEELDSIGVVY
jgi:hypothetical protein